MAFHQVWQQLVLAGSEAERLQTNLQQQNETVSTAQLFKGHISAT